MRIEGTTKRTGRLAGSTWWLIGRDEDGRLKPLLVDHGGEWVMPVFSFEEEADLFLRLGGFDEGWRGRQSGAGEIVSVLYGPCPGVKSVALDPLPGMMKDWTLDLVTLAWRPFVEGLLGREKEIDPATRADGTPHDRAGGQ